MAAQKSLFILRTERKLRQKDLAQLLGVDTSTVAGWEIGRRCPSLKMAKAVARIFGVRVEDIVFGKEDTPRQTAGSAAAEKRRGSR